MAAIGHLQHQPQCFFCFFFTEIDADCQKIYPNAHSHWGVYLRKLPDTLLREQEDYIIREITLSK